MYCTRCGTQNRDRSDYCFNCGTSLYVCHEPAANTGLAQAGGPPTVSIQPPTSIFPSRRLSSQFVVFAAVLTLSVLATALFAKRIRFEYDAFDNGFIAAGVSFVIALLAYWRFPKDYFSTVAATSGESVGDSGGEHLAIPRGKYDASAYVGIAFFGQVALVGTLVASMVSLVPRLEATSDGTLTVAVIAALSTTLWVYSDRWRCIEAYSSQFCSGIVNLSVLYVPTVAFIYANYRAMMRLKGR